MPNQLQSLATYSLFPSSVTSIHFTSPSTFLSSSRSRSIVSSSITSSKRGLLISPLRSTTPSGNIISSVSSSSSSSPIASSSWDGLSRTFSPSLLPTSSLSLTSKGLIFSSISPSSSLILTAGFDSLLRLISLNPTSNSTSNKDEMKQELLCEIGEDKNGHKGWTNCGLFITDEVFVTGGEDGKLKFFSLSSSSSLDNKENKEEEGVRLSLTEVIPSLSGNNKTNKEDEEKIEGIKKMSLSKDKKLLCCSGNNKAFIYDVSSISYGKEMKVEFLNFVKSQEKIEDVCFGNNGECLFVLSKKKVTGVKGDEEVCFGVIDGNEGACMGVSEGGEWVVVGMRSGDVQCFGLGK